MNGKARAATEAVRAVRSGMVLGLGTGSTAELAIAVIGEKWRARELRDIVGVSTSVRSAELASQYGIPLATLEEQPLIDLAIDGADEVSPSLDLVKGLGGALLREKAVERRAKHFVVIVDESKMVDRLGMKAPIPVEIGKHDWLRAADSLALLGCNPSLRGGSDTPFLTDNDNYIIDCRFIGGIVEPGVIAERLDANPAVKAHGLFLGMASVVIIGSERGVRRLERGDKWLQTP